MTYAAFGATDIIGGTRVYSKSTNYGPCVRVLLFSERVFVSTDGALWWFPFCCIFGVLAWFWMSDMPQHGNKPLLTRLGFYCCMQGNAYLASGAAVGIFVATFNSELTKSPGGKIARIFILVFCAAIIMHLLMWFASPGEVKSKLEIQAAIFKNKHTYIMTWLYIMCFGSFIGYSGAFPKLIQVRPQTAVPEAGARGLKSCATLVDIVELLIL